MTRNINDVLEQGERLDRVENMSGNLAMESKKYAKKAKDLSRQALIQKYMPVSNEAVACMNVWHNHSMPISQAKCLVNESLNDRQESARLLNVQTHFPDPLQPDNAG